MPSERQRITPAGAGKTDLVYGKSLYVKDHPRRCGENSHIGFWGMLGKGSPPQVRGKLSLSCSLLGVTRITPAGAGKTPYTNRCSSCAQDHPRRCGENSQLCSPYFKAPGSPPQVRGKPLPPGFLPVRFRITPAGAGKTKYL